MLSNYIPFNHHYTRSLLNVPRRELCHVMNPIPFNLRHLAALFDHYNFDAKGHFLGESSSYYLSTNPALPLLTNSAAPTTSSLAASSSPRARSSRADGTHEALGSSATDLTSVTSNLSFSSEHGHTAAIPSTSTATGNTATAAVAASSSLPQAPSSPGPRLGLSISAADAVINLTSGASTSTSFSVYSDSEFPVVAQSPAVLSQFPPPRLARELIALFLSKVNRFAPIVPSMFLEEYDTGVPQSPLLLLAIFSIASKYSTDPMCRSDPTRAQTAGENYCKTACRLVEEFLDRPRLSTVQGLFLLGKHLEETKNQTFLTKSFMYIGMAVRMALDMGLNRDCSGWGLGPPQVEYRNRTWWCLYVLDRAQGSINGRPFLIQDHDCAAGKPKPDPLAHNPAHEQMDVEYILHLIHITSLLGRVVNSFYITNTSGSDYFSSSWNTRGRSAEGSSEPLTSTTGSRKKSKTTRRAKPRSQDQEGSMDEFSNSGSAPNGDPGQDAGASTNRTTGEPQARQDMLARQRLSNQKQDALVAELDRELTEWVQSLPPRLQWDSLQNHPNVFGDTLHSIYYAVLILLHRPSVRVGELMPLSPVSRPDESLSEPDTIVTVEGSHSLAVCAQAARRITSLAERCDNLMHLERFGIGAYSLLHAARMHLIIAAVPTPPRKTGGRAGGCGAGAQFMEAIRRKEQAVDQFHRTLGSLRKFSVYHWTMDGIGLSIRTFERTLAAILQEQEIDQEQELKRQRERLAQYDTEFFDRDHNGSVVVAVDNTSATVNEAPTDENAASENKSEDELFYERTYYESMRFLEMRLLYQERHRHSKGSRPEEYLRRLDFLSQLNPGMGFASRGGHLDSTVPALTHRSITRNTVELFDNNAPLTPRPDGTIAHKAANISSVPTPNVPGLVIKTYKPNVSGRSKRRHASNAVTSGAASTSIRSKPTSGPPKTTENNSISTGHPAERAMLQDDADMNSSVDTSMSTTYANNASSNAVGVPSVSATYTRNHRNEVLSSNESPLSMTEFRPVEWTLPSSASQGIMDSQMQQPPRPSQFNSSGVPLVSIAAHDAPTGQSSGGASSSIATAVMSGIRLNGHGATRGQSTQHSPSRKHGRPVYRSERLFLQQQQHNQMQQHLDLQSRQYHYQQRLLQQQPQPQSSPSLQHPEQMQAQQRQSSSPSNMQAGQTPVQQESSHQQNPATQLRKNAYIITTPSTGKTNPDILMVYANDMDSEVCETSVLVHTQQLPPQHVQKHLQHQPPQHIQKHMEQQARYTLRTRSSGPLQVQNHQQLEHNMLLPLQQQAPTFSQPIEQQRGYQGERQQGQNQSHVFAQQVNQPATETQAYSQNRHQVPMPGEDIGQGNLPSGFGSGQPVSHSQMLHRQQMQRQQQSQQQHHHQISGHRPPQTSNGSPAGSSASLMSPSPAASSNSTTPSPMTHSSAIVPGLPVTPSAGPVIHLASVTGAMGLFDTDFPSDTPNNADSGVDGSQQMPSGGGNNDMYWDQFG